MAEVKSWWLTSEKTLAPALAQLPSKASAGLILELRALAPARNAVLSPDGGHRAFGIMQALVTLSNMMSCTIEKWQIIHPNSGDPPTGLHHDLHHDLRLLRWIDLLFRYRSDRDSTCILKASSLTSLVVLACHYDCWSNRNSDVLKEMRFEKKGAVFWPLGSFLNINIWIKYKTSAHKYLFFPDLSTCWLQWRE